MARISSSGSEMIGACTLTVNDWHGPLPTPGTYMRTVSGRTAYEIVEFRPSREGSKALGRLKCRRVEPGEIPEGATVFEWQWAKR